MIKYKPKPIIYYIPCERVISDIFSILEVHGAVRIQGLGDFSLRKIKSRWGWNPGEKKKMKIPAYTKVHFKPDTKFTNYFKD